MSVGGSAAYMVRVGDTLGQIAQRELGSSTRWQEILELNPGLDPRRLAIGTRLAMPAGAVRAPEKPRSQEIAAATKSPPTARELAQTGRRGGRVK